MKSEQDRSKLDPRVAQIRFSQLKNDDMKNLDITLDQIIDLDEQNKIKYHEYYFAVQGFADLKGHLKNNPRTWERVLDRFNTMLLKGFQHDMMYQLEWSIMKTICRALSQIEDHHEINPEIVK